MTKEITSSSINDIRSELVDIATGFLQNSKISNEPMDRKRKFLQKKGLTDTEINYAFEFISQSESAKEIVANHHHSSFIRRFLNNLAVAGFIVLAYEIFQNFFQSNEKNQLNETIQTLEKTIENMQININKLQQTADQLNLTIQSSNPNRLLAINEIKQDIQNLKDLVLNRSQISSRQLKSYKRNTTSDNDNDGIIIISEQDKKSDDE